MRQKDSPLLTLLLCADENSGRVDKLALREAGLGNVRVMTSGVAAAKLLSGMIRSAPQIPDLVVCLTRLEDMDGEQFCAIIRQHPRLLGLPILLIMPNDNEAAQLKTFGCGASALLARPYSVDTLKKSLAPLLRGALEQRKLRQAAEQADTSAFDDALATYGLLLRSERKPEDYFKAGMKALEESRWSAAIAAFERALRDAQIRAEAELGIAAAYKGKGDMRRFRAWLARASETFVAAKRWNRARSAYARLLQHDPSARNPFLAQAHKLIRERRYDDAAATLVQSLNLLPKIRAGERYARVCMAADEPEEMLEALEKSLRAEGDHDFLATDIRASLDTMTRQREQNRREQAVERKWQLAQTLAREALKKEERNRAAEKDKTANLRGEPVEIREAEPVEAVQVADFGESGSSEDELGGDELAALAPEPFGQKEATSAMFAKKPRLNELFSVIKLTWKLSRRAKKEISG